MYCTNFLDVLQRMVSQKLSSSLACRQSGYFQIDKVATEISDIMMTSVVCRNTQGLTAAVY